MTTKPISWSSLEVSFFFISSRLCASDKKLILLSKLSTYNYQKVTIYDGA